MDYDNMIDRITGVIKLDAGVFDEVEHNESLNMEALVVVVLTSIIVGLANIAQALWQSSGLTAAITGFVSAVVIGIIGYYIFAYVAYFVGTRLFGGTATSGELRRTLGYAHAPLILAFFQFVPICGGFVWMAAYVWFLIASIIAIRQALDFDTVKALVTSIAGWIIVVIISVLMQGMFGFGLALGGFNLGPG